MDNTAKLTQDFAREFFETSIPPEQVVPLSFLDDEGEIDIRELVLWCVENVPPEAWEKCEIIHRTKWQPCLEALTRMRQRKM